TLLYVWNPSIIPDQPWMMRRYLPAVIPGLLLLAALTSQRPPALIRRQVPSGSVPFVTAGVTVVAVSVFVLSPLRLTAPPAATRWQAGGFRGVHTVCEEIGGDAVVLFASDQDAWRPLMTPIRAICDVPVLRTSGEDPVTGSLAEVERVARSDGRSLWVLARS